MESVSLARLCGSCFPSVQVATKTDPLWMKARHYIFDISCVEGIPGLLVVSNLTTVLTQAVLWSPLNHWNAVLCSSYAWLLYSRTEGIL